MQLSEKQIHVLITISYGEHFNYQNFSAEERSACDELRRLGLVSYYREKLDGKHEVPTMVQINESGKAWVDAFHRDEQKAAEEKNRDRTSKLIAVVSIIATIAISLLKCSH